MDNPLPSGAHTLRLNPGTYPAGCYKIDLFFDHSVSSNSYGLVLIE